MDTQFKPQIINIVFSGLTLVAGLININTSFADTSQQSLTAKEILLRSDKIRNPQTPFATQMTLTEYNKAKMVDIMELKVHSKKRENNGQYRSLVEFLQPSRDSGKLMLQNGSEIWFYDPAAKNSIRLSAQQRLMGQASNGDVMTTNFAMDYEVSLAGKAVIKDADRKLRSVNHLHMVAKTENVIYAFADFWVEKETNHPVKAKFYSSSNRLMKIAYYRRFQLQLGVIRPTEVLIIDGVNTNKVTRMQMNNYRVITIPEAWFQRSFLPRFKG